MGAFQCVILHLHLRDDIGAMLDRLVTFPGFLLGFGQEILLQVYFLFTREYLQTQSTNLLLIKDFCLFSCLC